jgi:Sec-independent protein translocase protein TatA
MKQAQALVDYLLLGPGAKSSKTKGLLESYIKNVKAVMAEIEQSDEDEGEEEEEKPKTEAEEEEALKAERELWKARERQLLEEAGRRTFTGWSEKDWEDLAKNYFKGI